MLLCNLLRSFTWDKKNSEILGATNVRIFVVRMTQIRLRDVRIAWKGNQDFKIFIPLYVNFLGPIAFRFYDVCEVTHKNRTKQNKTRSKTNFSVAYVLSNENVKTKVCHVPESTRARNVNFRKISVLKMI